MTSQTGSTDPDSIRAISLLAMAVRWRTLLLFGPLGLCALYGVLAILRGPRYSASASFTPEMAERGGGGLAGIAAQFGIRVGTAALGDPIRFYQELLTSRDLLREAVESRYEAIGGQTLVEWWSGVEATDVEASPKAVRRLRGMISVNTNLGAGLVRLTVVGARPDLATELCRRLLTLVAEFNQRRRQTNAGTERAFLQEQMIGASRELTEAEEAHRVFLERNRLYASSPELRTEAARLERQIDLAQQLYVSVAQAFQQARIEEIRNTPILTVVEAPEGSAKRADRYALDLVMWAIIGFVMASTAALGLEMLEGARQAEARRTP